MERLQKYLSACGVASRRKSEELILQGKVKVNGIVVKELGIKVSDKDEVIKLAPVINAKADTSPPNKILPIKEIINVAKEANVVMPA